MKRKKRKKTRTQNKFENAIISGMRRAFSMYSPKYEEALSLARFEMPKRTSTGKVSKVPEVRYLCNECKLKYPKNKVEVDHVDNLIELHKTRKDYTLDELLARLDCPIDQLQVLCLNCHSQKSSLDRKKRQKLKSKG